MGSVWSKLSAALGVVLLLAAGLLAFFQEDTTKPASAAKQSELRVLEVRQPVAAGGTLMKSNMVWRQIVADTLPEGAIVLGSAQAEQAVGANVARPLAAGELVRFTDLIETAKSKSLAIQLNPGMRAVTIPIDPTQARAAAVMPQDRIDVLVTPGQSIDTALNGGTGPAVSARVYRNLRVLAIDGKSASTLADMANDLRGSGSGGSLTVEVPAALAPQLAAGVRTGLSSVLLRRPFDAGPEAPDPIMPRPAAAAIAVPAPVTMAPQATPMPKPADGSVASSRSTDIIIVRGQP